jgi:hypothetical protein
MDDACQTRDLSLYAQVLTIDGNPLVAVESGVLAQGAQALVDLLDYNHAYDLKDKNILPPAPEQRRQIDAAVEHLNYELLRLQNTSMEAQYRNIGGTNIIQLAVSQVTPHMHVLRCAHVCTPYMHGLIYIPAVLAMLCLCMSAITVILHAHVMHAK